jgi:hypothetical protein
VFQYFELLLWGLDLRAAYQCCYRAFALAAFGTGLLVKTPVIWYIARISWPKSAITALAMSIAWWVLDVIVIGFALAALIFVFRFDPSLSGWFTLIALAPMMRSGLETLVLRFAYSRRIGRKGYWLLGLANTGCIIVAICAFILYDRAHPAIAIVRHL